MNIKQLIEKHTLFSKELLQELSKHSGKVAMKLCELEGIEKGTEKWRKRYNTIRSFILQEQNRKFKQVSYKHQKAFVSYYAYKQFSNSKCTKIAFKAFGYSAELYDYLKVFHNETK